jgi:hypothetical protein
MMSRWLLLAMVLLSGCHVSQPRPAPDPSAGFHYYPLLPPGSFGRSLEIEQHLQGQFRDQSFQLHVRIEIEANQLLVVGFTAFQSRAFVLRYDGSTLAFQNLTGRVMTFPAEMILSDMQQVLWPTLPDRQGWRVVDDTVVGQRLMFFDNRLVTRIQYNGTLPVYGETVLLNLRYGYRLHIRTVAIEAP